MFVINTGKAKGTTFKIKVKDLVFSSLFDTGAQVSCIRYDTVSELDLLHQISESSTCIRTANGQDVGVKGSILVSFQIGSCSFTHQFIVCKGITRPIVLGEDFLSRHCFKLGWTDDNKRFAEYKGKVIAIASQAVMDDRIMVSRPVRIPARHFAITPTKCPNMFNLQVDAISFAAFSSSRLTKTAMETQKDPILLTVHLIGTVYRNYHRPVLIISFIFPDLLPKILRTSSQGRACPTRTYACLIKHYSNSQ